MDREHFSADLKKTVETDVAYRAKLRIFVSKGLKVFSTHGSIVGVTKYNKIFAKT